MTDEQIDGIICAVMFGVCWTSGEMSWDDFKEEYADDLATLRAEIHAIVANPDFSNA